MEHAPSPSVDALVEQLRQKVEERRQAGLYPAELEHDLHAHFARITAHRVLPDLSELSELMRLLDGRMAFSPSRIDTASGMPGGGQLHSLVGKVVARQTQGIIEQVQEYADGVREVLRALIVALQDPHIHVHADLIGQLDAVFERLGSYERGPVESPAAVDDLRRRVEQLEAAERRRRFSPWFTNDAFEASFRGERVEMLERYRDLAQLLGLSAPVLDIGCGRGEFLQLLTEYGIECRGIEIDPALVRQARAEGFEVELGDAIEALAETPDRSLGGIVLIQVVEHLTSQQVVDLVALALDKLRPGGKMIVETVNPQSLYVYAHSFYLDPTHTQPVHPAYLRFLFEQAGFAEAKVEWRSPVPPDDMLEAPPEGGVAADNVARLNRLLFDTQDYALIATR